MDGSRPAGSGTPRIVTAAVLLVSVAVAGCLGTLDPAHTGDGSMEDAGSATGATRIVLDDRGISGLGGVQWNGSELTAQGEGDEAGCPSEACEVVPFNVSTPGGGTGSLADQLVVAATTDPYSLEEDPDGPQAAIHVRVKAADGDVVAEASDDHFSSVAVVQDPEPGGYVAEIRASSGSSPYVGGIHAQDEPGEEGVARDLLPDVVTMPVIHLTQRRAINAGPFEGLTTGGEPSALHDAGLRGCGPYEMAEDDVRHCLRFTTSIGNLGKGPLELHLDFDNAAAAKIPGLEGSFTQVIHRTDGSTTTREAGAAEYHAAHGHYHKVGFADYTLYEHDNATDTRGEVVREGHKTSWCLVDMGVVAPGTGHFTQPARYPLQGSRNPTEGGSNCGAATPDRDMVTGITEGWWDMYEWFVADQYVEVSDLPDGTYELVAKTDPEGQVLESNPDNNAGGVVFAWSDGEVEVLQRWSDAVGG